MNAAETEALVLRYWRSWQRQDFAEMRACLADRVRMGIGTEATTVDTDEFAEQVSGGAPWENVTMQDSVFADGHAAFLYTAHNTGTDSDVTVAEFLRCADGKITELRGVFGGPPPEA